MSRRTIYSLAFATSVLAPLTAHALPLSAVAKAEARHELLLVGGTFTAKVPCVAHESTVISIGDVIGAALATPALSCTVPSTSCIFGGSAAATAIASSGRIRVEAGVGPFSVDVSIADFTLIGPVGEPVGFAVDPGDPTSFALPIGSYTLVRL